MAVQPRQRGCWHGNLEGLDIYLQLHREVRCISSAVVVGGEAKVQALVRVWRKTQLVLRTQQ